MKAEPDFMYELFLHYKQGVDFGSILAKNPDVSEALLKWAEDFKWREEACRKLAAAFKGKGIAASADGHFIEFTAESPEGTQALEDMVKAEILEKREIESEEDDEPVIAKEATS